MNSPAADVIRWGFLGAGFVASRAMAPAVHAADGAVLQRVAARDIERAASLGPVHSSSSYADVVEADDVDAVYISLTNEAHEEWVMASLAAGKHVLCEKPLSMTAASVMRLMTARESTSPHSPLLIEALWYRWHPRFARTMELLASGAVGTVHSVQARFCFQGVPLDNYRLDPKRGGGAILDVGPYVLDAALMAARAGGAGSADELEIVTRDLVRGDPAGMGEVMLSLDAGIRMGRTTAQLSISIDRPAQQEFRVEGDQGTLVWTGGEAFTVWKQACELELVNVDGLRIETFEPVDPYRLMVEQSMRSMAGREESLMPVTDSLLLAHGLDVLQGSPATPLSGAGG